MRNKNLKLSIQEIADLKEGRKSLEEIKKTHDGTSLGKIGPILDEWVKEDHWTACAGFDENWEKIYESEMISSNAGPSFLKEAIDGNAKGKHLNNQPSK